MEEFTRGLRAHHDFDPDDPPMFTRRRLLVGGAAVAGTLAIWSRSNASSRGGSASEGSTASINGGETLDVAVQPIVGSPPTTVGLVALQNDLAHDMVGPEVKMLQERLTEVGFDPGPLDGVLGESTLRSVWAYEKLILGTPREEMQGIVTADIWERMNEPTGVAPRRTPGGTHLEIYLPEQSAVLYIDGAIRLISHISSGEGVEWCSEVLIDNDDGTQTEKGICGDAVTPGGVYHFDRKVEGWRNAKLGRLYKPTYFNYGIAIHGASNVPPYPASRGCVRFPMHIAEYLQDLVSIGDAVYVFDGVEEPETYGAQPMTFDWPDPDWVPPSTTSTTTTTPTTSTPTAAPSTTTPTTSTPHPAQVPDTTVLPTTTTAPPAPATTTTTLPTS